MLRSLIVAVAALTIAAHAMPASAQEVVELHVSFADLNLSSAAGQTVLAQRLNRAVEDVCGSSNEVSFESAKVVVRCQEDTSKGVRASVRAAIAQASKATLLASR